MIATTGEESHSYPYQVISRHKSLSREFQKPLTSGKNKQNSAKERVVLTRFSYSEILLNNVMNGKDNSTLTSLILKRLLIASIE